MADVKEERGRREWEMMLSKRFEAIKFINIVRLLNCSLSEGGPGLPRQAS
jgi:hypothetical protein